MVIISILSVIVFAAYIDDGVAFRENGRVASSDEVRRIVGG